MTISDKKLPFDGNVEVLSKLTSDYLTNISSNRANVKAEMRYKITCGVEPNGIERSARKAALGQMVPKMVKQAFDTRNIDQERERNPRGNLQFWHRTDPFITKEDENKLNVFSKLMGIVKDIRAKYEYAPEYFNSYVRVLFDHLGRILRLNINDQDYSDAQLAYLEQLLFARYRLELKDIVEKSDSELEKILLSKDEDLMKRGVDSKPLESKANGFINTGKTNNYDERILALLEANLKQNNQSKDALGELFGGSLRMAGDKKVNRTITIHICDEAVD